MEDKLSSEAIEDKTKSADTSRRRFTKASLAASGVILTLASRPVLANAVCKSPSGFHSGNTSAHPIEEMCFGNYPDYYANTPEAWAGTKYDPGTYDKEEGSTNSNKSLTGIESSTSNGNSNNNGNSNSKVDLGSEGNKGKWVGGTQFQEAFPGSNQFPGKSMMQVLWMGDPMGGHLCAALLNADLGLTPPLTETRIVDMCLEYETKGYFEPTAGIHWYEGDIIHYLNSLT
jgi:hypothetical protein